MYFIFTILQEILKNDFYQMLVIKDFNQIQLERSFCPV
ncbi:hypothetical protein LEP1GSC008_2387 [Leptospira kirschneri serovar Bulgarica str. Nikolaevo]|uniref:Uncharacterized protein n=1 Tax=Leptospira kirschneri serovar Bulgarica str. Nikolaevo TaxID=1240687 RepID=M6FT05_9LEPT|nr:hypothetical protein LEP1GSC008_2387 [Leptospira kirschneri serovar Bulgarica str. Nikolaevo]